MRKGLCTKNNNQKRGKQHVGSPSLHLPLFFQPVTCYTPSGVLVVVPAAGCLVSCAAVLFLPPDLGASPEPSEVLQGLYHSPGTL